ncbi:MAG: hypothetical protein ABIU85_09555 [Methylotenera sp.]
MKNAHATRKGPGRRPMTAYAAKVRRAARSWRRQGRMDLMLK